VVVPNVNLTALDLTFNESCCAKRVVRKNDKVKIMKIFFMIIGFIRFGILVIFCSLVNPVQYFKLFCI
jgi:hypothetical protein